MRFALRRFSDDFWVLDGGRNWACVEGSAEEWQTIAAALRCAGTVRFKRCATRPAYDVGMSPTLPDPQVAPVCMVLWSPRNAVGDDYVLVRDRECAELADHIEAELRKAVAMALAGEPWE